jgi:hypothetical protein
MGGPNYLNANPHPSSDGPDYLDPKTLGVDWNKHENDVAKRSGGRRRAASGAAPGKPADTVDQKFLRECKSTKGAGMSIKGDWLRKIVQQALPRGITPLMELRFDGQEAPTPTDWVMIPAQEFEILLERLRAKE